MAQTKQSSASFSFTELIELSQESWLASFRAVAQVGRATDRLSQNAIEASLTSQEAAARSMREYAKDVHQIREEWGKKAAGVMEKILSVPPSAIDYPFKREVEELTEQTIKATRNGFEFFTAPLAATARR